MSYFSISIILLIAFGSTALSIKSLLSDDHSYNEIESLKDEEYLAFTERKA